MDKQRLARLTEQQRTCLRFVYRHMTSKEIAPLLGVEPGTVDQHVKAALRVLDVADRRTAAILLAEHELEEERGRPADAQPLVYQPPGIAIPMHRPTMRPSVESGQFQRGVAGETLREEQRGFQVFSSAGAPTLPLPIGGARPNDLNWLARLAWIAAIAIGVALAFGALVSGVEALVRLITS